MTQCVILTSDCIRRAEYQMTSTFRDGLETALGGLACGAARSYRTLTANNPLAGILLGGAIPGIGAFLLERLYCDKDPYDRPFRPGECPIKYDVTVTWRVTGHPTPSANGTFSAFGQVFGPIGSASFEKQDVDEPGGRFVYRIFLVHNGDTAPPPGQQSIRRQWAGPGEFNEIASLVILNVESAPSDPAADNGCGGEVAPIPYDPRDFTGDTFIDYTVNNVNISLPFSFTIRPFILDVDLNLKMPVTFNIRPTVNFSPDFNFNFNAELNLTTGDVNINWVDKPPGQNDTPPPPAGEPSPGPKPNAPPPPPPPGIDEPLPDPEDEASGRRIVAAIVTSTAIRSPNRFTVLGQEGNPDIQIPSLGYLSFAIPTADGSVAWTNDIPIKNTRAYIPCPVPTGASAVRGTPDGAVDWAITPIYQEVRVRVS